MKAVSSGLSTVGLTEAALVIVLAARLAARHVSTAAASKQKVKKIIHHNSMSPLQWRLIIIHVGYCKCCVVRAVHCGAH